jgi:uncharacterized lipoprotein YmbA
MRNPFLICLLPLALAACGSPDYFLLPAPATVTSQPGSSASISVADISLPAYAESLEIALQEGTGTVSLNTRALWADAPRRALTRHLVAALQLRLRGQIGAEPWPGFNGPSLRVEVITDQLIGREDGSLLFAGQFTIVAPSSGQIRASERFTIAVPPQGQGYQALAIAHGRAIDALADRIAARITGRPVAG